MTDSLPLPAFSPGIKRTHDGLPVASGLELTPQTTHHSSTREVSPAPSMPSSPLSELTAPTPQPPRMTMAGNSTVTSAPTAPAAKKPKLTPAEKQSELLINKLVKEEKAKLKAEEKAKREQEKQVRQEKKRKTAEEKEAAKRQKDMEKAEKDAERAEKQKAKEEEKAKREAEKVKKEEEKAAEAKKKEAEKDKKERSQMRLGAFFNRPAPQSTPPMTPDKMSVGPSSRRSSITSIDMGGKVDIESTPAQRKSQLSHWILPFFLSENTELAPNNRFIKSNDAISGPAWLEAPSAEVKARCLFKSRRARTRRVVPVKQMVAKLDGTEGAPIDLTANYSGVAASGSLKQVPFKVLQFKEDVRPPYQGTYTRPVSPRSARKLSRQPAYRGLPDTDYDYDSEAEWQEPEPDDEDLEGDDDLSEEEDGAEEMDDFLDDEADAGKRLVSSSDVEPVSTGLCWDGQTELTVAGVELDQYQMQVMHDDQRLPIDPYATAHWKDDKQPEPTTETASMQPPRLPLANVSTNSTNTLRSFVTGAPADPVQKENPVLAAVRGRPKDPNKPVKPVKLIPDDVVPAFKVAVDGSDLNKIALVEILKKQFPKCSKDAIKGTLETVAVRVGIKEADKRWVLK